MVFFAYNIYLSNTAEHDFAWVNIQTHFFSNSSRSIQVQSVTHQKGNTLGLLSSLYCCRWFRKVIVYSFIFSPSFFNQHILPFQVIHNSKQLKMRKKAIYKKSKYEKIFYFQVHFSKSKFHLVAKILYFKIRYTQAKSKWY